MLDALLPPVRLPASAGTREPLMTLEEHAAAIEAAIQAAADEGFELDDGQGGPVRMELNRITPDRLLTGIPTPVPVFAPATYIY